MEKVVKIYNINSVDASKNMEELLSRPFFYWDVKSFETDEPGSEVYFICERTKKGLYTILETGRLPSTYEPVANSTSFSDNDFSHTAAGKWGDFVKFKIIEEAVIPEGWKFQDRLGNQNPVNYLYKYETPLNDIPKRIQKLKDLKKIFNGAEALKRIEEVLELLESKPSRSKTKVENKPMEKVQKPLKEILNHVHQYLEHRGFKYQKEEIINFYLALKAKPFVILAGISGTGKSQLPRKFAASLWFEKEQTILLPVRPDWTDSSDLLGYTSLDGTFIPKDLTIAIQRAIANPNKPSFIYI